MGYRTITLCFLIWFSQTSLCSQSVSPEDLLAAWDNMTKMVMETAKKIPAEDFSHRPAEDIRNLGEQINHITASNIGLGVSAFGKRPNFPLPNPKDPPTEKESILDILEKSFGFFKEQLQEMDAAGLEATVKWGPAGNRREVTRLQALLMIYSHLQLEYGKLTVYARATGVAPEPSAGWSF